VGSALYIVLSYYFCTMKQTIYEYFKKELDEATILVRIDPNTFSGLELIVLKNNQVKKTVRTFDETIYEDLKFDDFVSGNPLEFNLHLQNS
jgi:hypothetical protein